MEFEGAIMEFEGTIMEFEGAIMEFESTLMEFEGAIMEFEGAIMEFEGTIMEFEGTIMEFEKDIESCLGVLQAGGLILYPTDTVWGIGCDATNPEAVSKVYTLKQRVAAKSLIVLMADERDVLKYTSQPDLRVFDFLHTVQKPTTVIYEGAMGLADNLINADGTIAIRLVDDPFCRHLVKRFRKPLVSTSANISGEAAPAFFREIDPRIKDGVDYIAGYRRDDETPREPSAIVRWNADATVTVIRS